MVTIYNSHGQMAHIGVSDAGSGACSLPLGSETSDSMRKIMAESSSSLMAESSEWGAPSLCATVAALVVLMVCVASLAAVWLFLRVVAD